MDIIAEESVISYKKSFHKLSEYKIEENQSNFPFQEILLKCNLCQEEISCYLMNSHKKIHRAMSFFRIRKFSDIDLDNIAEKLSNIRQTHSNNLQYILTYERAYNVIYNHFSNSKKNDIVNFKILEETLQETQSFSIRPANPIFPYEIGFSFNSNSTKIQHSNGHLLLSLPNPNLPVSGDNIAANTPVNSYHLLLMTEGFNGASSSKFVAENFYQEFLSILQEKNQNKIIKSSENNETVPPILLQLSMPIDPQYYSANEIYEKAEMRPKSHYLKMPSVDSDIADCLKQTFLKLDRNLSYGVHEENNSVRISGCQVSCILYKDVSTENNTEIQCKKVANRSIIIAHVGACHVLCISKKNPPEFLTNDHSATNKKERRRIIESGGFIYHGTKEKLINGKIKMSRALGCHGDLSLKSCVISDPDIQICTVNDNDYIGLVIGNSDFWENMDKDQVDRLIQYEINQHEVSKNEKHKNNRFNISCKTNDLKNILDENLNEENNKTLDENQDREFPGTPSDRVLSPESFEVSINPRKISQEISEKLTNLAIICGAKNDVCVVFTLF